jgi:hypothetical protein
MYQERMASSVVIKSHDLETGFNSAASIHNLEAVKRLLWEIVMLIWL